jgi:glyoxalase family protein
MKLEGLHHITMITGDAQGTVDFYADVLGLRMVKQTVNFDQPEAYHLYFGDEQGAPGSILTWFEFPGASRGRAGAGTIHTLQLGVPAEAVLDFWGERLSAKGYASEMMSTRLGSAHAVAALRFADPDGLVLELVVADHGNPPLRAVHPEIAPQFAIAGLEGARAYSAYDAVEEKVLTETLGFSYEGEGGYVLRGEQRHFHWAHDPAPAHHGLQGAGSVHHIAWASRDIDHLAWRDRIQAAGGHVTEVRDRDYFRSIYFREPRGVLFEIATLSPGFAVDEDPEHLGEALRVPRQHAHLREQLERTLTPLINPRVARRQSAA